MRFIGNRAQFVFGKLLLPRLGIAAENTPPVAQTLITSAPYLRWRRT